MYPGGPPRDGLNVEAVLHDNELMRKRPIGL